MVCAMALYIVGKKIIFRCAAVSRPGNEMMKVGSMKSWPINPLQTSLSQIVGQMVPLSRSGVAEQQHNTTNRFRQSHT